MPESRDLRVSSNVRFDGVIKPWFILGVEMTDGRQFGNGFVLAEWPDIIITAAHVVSDAVSVRAKAWTSVSGTFQGFDCTAVAFDAATDLAVLRLPQSVALTRTLTMQPFDAGTVALRAYLDHGAWQGKRVIWPTVGATRSDKWLVYETRYGEQGASGAALVHGTIDDVVVGVHHGRVRIDSKIVRAAAVCDRAVLDGCRSLVR